MASQVEREISPTRAFFTKEKPLIRQSQKKQRDVQRDVGKPQRNSAIYDSTGPVLHQDRNTGKAACYQPVASKTELMASAISRFLL